MFHLSEATFTNMVHVLELGWDVISISANWLADNTLLLEERPGIRVI